MHTENKVLIDRLYFYKPYSSNFIIGKVMNTYGQCWRRIQRFILFHAFASNIHTGLLFHKYVHYSRRKKIDILKDHGILKIFQLNVSKVIAKNGFFEKKSIPKGYHYKRSLFKILKSKTQLFLGIMPFQIKDFRKVKMTFWNT